MNHLPQGRGVLQVGFQGNDLALRALGVGYQVPGLILVHRQRYSGVG